MTYREDQGRMARMFAFWSLVFVTLFGCSFLFDMLFNNVESLRTPLLERPLPIVRIEATGAFLIAAVIFLGLTALIWRWQQRRKVADFLIDTEHELRKVTWPSVDDVVNTSTVVVICVMILMGFLAFTDWFLGRLFQQLLVG
ncbi:preprotein translocase subunit SecE [Planctomycetes bacterium Pla163]|uniref:Protein translocase subunit SecE n=1 Tax=Rohdeia mirabilis TaxID=2528008 RepID=A0A518D2V7_9BACT|nr:preprotein translocase subunit SecE [Planctomycetes bacterium Pla163]